MASGTAMKIETITVASGGTSSIVFNNIPQTYNDLKIVASGRGTRNFETDDLVIRFNGSSTNYSGRRLYSGGGAPGSSATSDTLTDIRGFVPGSPTTADIFGNNEFYIANYTSSNNKSVQVHAVGENNGLVSYLGFTAGLWSNSSAITSITMLANNGNLTEFSTFTLYGITRIPQDAKATGGVIYDDSSYWYHVFTSSGIFTPNASMSCDVLVVAGGGGGGGTYLGGGGGAGGLRLLANQTVSSATVATIGSGGAGGPGLANPNGRGSTGTNSSFGSLAASGGGGGGSYGTPLNGGNGGSGGGGSGDGVSTGGTGNAGSYSPVEGYAGGSSPSSLPNYGCGGGGGAGGVGSAGTSTVGGNGGVGTDTYNSINFSSWLTATSTGSSSKFAGGGGGAVYASTGAGTGGSGGGGNGGNTTDGQGVAGVTNTGSGGGGSERGGGTKAGGAGGSGIVIVRYAK